MRVSNTKSIDGVEYTVQMFSASKGTKWANRLQKIILPLVGQFASSGGMKMDVSSEAFSRMASMLTQVCDEDTYVLWIKDLIAGTVARTDTGMVNVSETFDVHFQGRILHLHKVVAFVLEVNFQDFFGGLSGLGAKLQALAAGQMSTPAQ